MAGEAVPQRSAKTPGLALVLSLLWCGVGQIYNGQVGKGVLFLILYGISILLMLALIGFITTPILWIWGMVDAYRTAERINQEIIGPQKRCPHCAELINAGAMVCRHCGRELGTASATGG